MMDIIDYILQLEKSIRALEHEENRYNLQKNLLNEKSNKNDQQHKILVNVHKGSRKLLENYYQLKEEYIDLIKRTQSLPQHLNETNKPFGHIDEFDTQNSNKIKSMFLKKKKPTESNSNKNKNKKIIYEKI